MLSYQSTPFGVLQAVAALAAALVACILWRRRHEAPGVPFLIGACAAAAFWSAMGAVELLAPSLQTKILASQLSYLGIICSPLLIWHFAYCYTKDGARPPNLLVRALWLLSLVTLLLVFTNRWHGLVWDKVYLADTEGSSHAIYSRGPWFWVNLAQCYGLMLATALLLGQHLIGMPELYRRQGWGMIVAVTFPWFFSFFYILRVPFLGTVDNTPIGIVLTGLLLSWNVLGQRLFEVVPFAGSTLFERMPDPVFVTDKSERLIQANPAALARFNIPKQHAGIRLSEILSAHPPLLVAISRFGGKDTGPIEDKGAWWDIESSLLTDLYGHPRGRLFVLREATALQNARLRADELARQAHAANLAKSAFLAQVSHDLRTPMHAILGITEVLVKSPTLPAAHLAGIETIHEAGESLLRLINDLLDLSRIEAGRVDLSNEAFMLDEVLDPLAELLGFMARRKNITLVHWIEPGLEGGLRGDPGRLRQLLLNVAGNAIKFTQTGSVTIRARPSAGSEKTVVIEVRDTGPGISKARLSTLFSPFDRGDPSVSAKVEGTGLGLTIAHQLAVAMKGTIEVSSEPGLGSLFSISLPIVDNTATSTRLVRLRSRCQGRKVAFRMDDLLARKALVAGLGNMGLEPVEWQTGEAQGDTLLLEAGVACDRATLAPWLQPGRRVLPVDSRSQPPTDGTLPLQRLALASAVLGEDTARTARAFQPPQAPLRLRTLLADDSPLSRRASLALLQHCGCVAEAVDNGKAALEKIRQNRYDLVILDGQMPEMDGWEVSELLHSPGFLAGPLPRVIALSADLTPDAQARWKRVGADIILPKPIHLANFRETIAGVPKITQD